jgi:hypothetical protein
MARRCDQLSGDVHERPHAGNGGWTANWAANDVEGFESAATERVPERKEEQD